MSSVRIIGEPPDPAKVFAIFDEEARNAGRPARDLVRNALESATPRDSGRTAEAIRDSYRKTGDGYVGTVRFGQRTHIARWLDRGTRPRVIRPKAGRRRGRAALTIPGVGYRQSAQHPGTGATNFIEQTEQRVRPALEQIYDQAAARAAQRVERL